jgi:hypothetical protein
MAKIESFITSRFHTLEYKPNRCFWRISNTNGILAPPPKKTLLRHPSVTRRRPPLARGDGGGPSMQRLSAAAALQMCLGTQMQDRSAQEFHSATLPEISLWEVIAFLEAERAGNN